MAKGLGTALIAGGVGMALGYLKCMSDVTKQQGEVEVNPTKHTKLVMRKITEEKKES